MGLTAAPPLEAVEDSMLDGIGLLPGDEYGSVEFLCEAGGWSVYGKGEITVGWWEWDGDGREEPYESRPCGCSVSIDTLTAYRADDETGAETSLPRAQIASLSESLEGSLSAYLSAL